MAAIQARIIRLEEAARRRHSSGLSGERRKMLTDLAVLHGDMAASEELSHFRREITSATNERRQAAIAAGLRADQ